MKSKRRILSILIIILVISVLFSSCATPCCNTERSRIEADIAMATDKKEDVESVQLDAYRRVMWAEQNSLKSDFLEQYNDAINAIKSADLAYDNLKYSTSKKLYQIVISILSDDFKTLSMECRAEKARVDSMIKKALDAGADKVAQERFKAAQDLYVKAMALKSAGDLPNAIATCKKAAAAYEYAAEYACVIKIKAAIDTCDLLKDYSKEYAFAESKVLADQSLWNYGSVKDYEQGTIFLREAKQYYLAILEQCQKVAVEKGTLEVQATPCDRSNLELFAKEKAEAERRAQEAQARLKAEADAALACAEERIAWADAEGIKAEYPEIYAKALAEMQIAKSLYERNDYSAAQEHASTVCEVLSDEFKSKVAADREKKAQEQAEAERLALERAAQEKAEMERLAREKAEAERLAQEQALLEQAQKAEAERRAQEAQARLKAEADAALACAEERIAWADAEGIKAEYPEIYAKALAEMQIAKSLYERNDYSAAQEHASTVCEVLSDEFKIRVEEERKKAAQSSEQPVIVIPLKASAIPVPDHFSPDGDGNNDVVSFNLNAEGGNSIKQWKFEIFEEAIVDPTSAASAKQRRLFAQRSGTGEPPETFVWNGKSDKNELVESGVFYPFIFTVFDESGDSAKAEGKVRADILVIKKGETIELRVPSFVFRPDTADFLGLNKDIISMNLDLLEQLAKLFNALPDYVIKIEGHANNVGKMLGYSLDKIQAEEKNEVLPLSLSRAEKIKSLLVEKGVAASRISVEGRGSSKPIVSFTDVVNRWKNRRVEFILNKK